MSFKKTKVVMLPTNEKAKFNDLVIHPIGGLLVQFKFQNCTEVAQHLYFLSDEEIKENDWYVCWETIDGIASNYEIGNKPLHSFCIGAENYKKIIATTDKSLSEQIMYYPNGAIIGGIESYKLLPQPSQSFIEKFVEEYNEGNVITEVMVEYKECCGRCIDGVDECIGDRLKINPKDNTITIRKVKDSWNRDEVRELLITAYSKGRTNILLREFNEWLKENL